MKKIKSLIFAVAFVFAITFAGSSLNSNGSLSVNAQDTMMGKIGNGVQKTTVKVYRGGRRIGTTVGRKTWNGSKWVASKSWRGGRWVAIKTVHGTKWVYRKAKYPFVSHPRRRRL
ncbi:MAG: hypothetical protein ACKVQJ_12590 [Pyrinomonadaceae bacterium]